MACGELRGRVPSWVTRRMENVNCGILSPLFMETEKNKAPDSEPSKDWSREGVNLKNFLPKYNHM